MCANLVRRQLVIVLLVVAHLVTSRRLLFLTICTSTPKDQQDSMQYALAQGRYDVEFSGPCSWQSFYRCSYPPPRPLQRNPGTLPGCHCECKRGSPIFGEGCVFVRYIPSPGPVDAETREKWRPWAVQWFFRRMECEFHGF